MKTLLYTLISFVIVQTIPQNFLLSQGMKVNKVKIAIKHKVYTDFYEEHTVKPNKIFQISDTDYSAKVVEFNPDFIYDKETKKVSSRSNNINNPAVKIVIYKNKKKIDEVWAFKGIIVPHFSPQSVLTFMLLDYELIKK